MEHFSFVPSKLVELMCKLLVTSEMRTRFSGFFFCCDRDARYLYLFPYLCFQMRWFYDLSSILLTMTLIHLTPSNRLTLILSSAFLLRLLLQTQTSLPDLLTSRLEISTPITSFKRCTIFLFLYWQIVKEGLFLYEHGVPPYNGGVCHQVCFSRNRAPLINV